MILEVLESRRAAVQDLGRRRAHDGLATGGAPDQDAARTANALVGNAPGEPHAELLLAEAAVRLDADALVAVTGTAAAVEVGGVPVDPARAHVVPDGAELWIGPAEHGLISCLAVAGRWDVPRFAGSAAPDPALGFATALAPGTRVRIEGPRRLVNPVLGVGLLDVRVPAPLRPDPVPLLPGPDLTLALRERLPDVPLRVDPRSDRVGVRLAGELPVVPGRGPLLSQGVAIGAVEVAGPGELIVLQRDRVLTAGYPVVAVVPVVAQGRLAQARPGEEVRFRWTTEAEALSALRTRRALLDRTADRVRTALRAL